MKHKFLYEDDECICQKCRANLKWPGVELYQECPEIADPQED